MSIVRHREDQVSDALAKISLSPGISIRAYRTKDFESIQRLSSAEGWTTPADRPKEARSAWRRSWPALVATDEKGEVIGFVRALTDGEVTTYICELLVVPDYRQKGLGSALLGVCHHLYPNTRLDLLSTESADQFYEAIGCRRFQGFRKSYW